MPGQVVCWGFSQDASQLVCPLVAQVFSQAVIGCLMVSGRRSLPKPEGTHMMAMQMNGRVGARGLVAWIKSAHSDGGDDSDCVEVLEAGGGVAVRDSKVPDGPLLWFTRTEWQAFLAGAKDGQFDHLAQSA